MPSEDITFVKHGDIDIAVYRHVPPDPQAVLLVVHGFGDYSGRYLHLVEYFKGRGFAIVLFDHIGHGRSGGKRADVEDFDDWVDVLHEIIQEVKRSDLSHLPLYLIGHSIGGLVVINCLSRCADRVDGAVISSPSIRLTVARWKLWFGPLLGFLLPGLRAPTGIKPEMISGDSAEQTSYRDEPLINHRITARAWWAMIKFYKKSDYLAVKIHHPILMLQERGDRVCSAKDTEEFFKRIPEDKRELIIYDGDYHEPFNDVIRDKVFDDILNWIERRMEKR